MSMLNVSMTTASNVVVSIVSHGHGMMVQRLLLQLAADSAPHITRVVVTHNVSEPKLQPPEKGWPFIVQTVVNARPLGFGENHNRALTGASESWVCVLNPDVELIEDREPFSELLAAADSDAVGCIYPMQLDEVGRIQESERELPTPLALWRRRALGRHQRRVDWVNAAFLLIPNTKWQALGGFDTGFFMYCEDVDLSLRLRLRGWSLVNAPAQVIHIGQRASSRSWKHLFWHARSLLRLWTSATFWRYLSCMKKLKV